MSDDKTNGSAFGSHETGRVHVLHPDRPPQVQDRDADVRRAMRRLLAEWAVMVKKGELASLVLVGGLAADGRTVDAYASLEDPLTTIGRLRQVEHMILSSKDDAPPD